MSKKQSRALVSNKLEYQYRMTRLFRVTTATVQLGQSLLQWAGIVFVAWFLYKSIDSLSGRATFTQMQIDVLGNIKVSETVAYIFGGSSLFYGWRQKRLRKKKIAELTKRIQNLERAIDPKRSSSKLPSSGETREGDRYD